MVVSEDGVRADYHPCTTKSVRLPRCPLTPHIAKRIDQNECCCGYTRALHEVLAREAREQFFLAPLFPDQNSPSPTRAVEHQKKKQSGGEDKNGDRQGGQQKAHGANPAPEFVSDLSYSLCVGNTTASQAELVVLAIRKHLYPNMPSGRALLQKHSSHTDALLKALKDALKGRTVPIGIDGTTAASIHTSYLALTAYVEQQPLLVCVEVFRLG